MSGHSGRGPRSRRTAAYLAMLIGGFGFFVAVSGAATFLPYRTQDLLSVPTAQALTVISAVAAALSAVGLLAGWGLLQHRSWAWSTALGVALGSVATVGTFAGTMPTDSPSPVPGGPNPWVLFAVVTAAYAVEVAFLLLDRATGAGRSGRRELSADAVKSA